MAALEDGSPWKALTYISLATYNKSFRNRGTCCVTSAWVMTCQTSSLAPALPEPPEPAQCHKWPRLPRKTKVAVSKCHAGHAKVMDEPAEKQGWMNQSQSESLLAQGKSAQLSWTKRSTAMPVLCSRARNGTCAQGKCSWCHKAASSLCQDNVFWDIG